MTSLSDQIEKVIHLPSWYPSPGPIRMHPPLRQVANAIGDDAIERVTIVKPVRFGLTTLLTSSLLVQGSISPVSALILLPTCDVSEFVDFELRSLLDENMQVAVHWRGEAGRFSNGRRYRLSHLQNHLDIIDSSRISRVGRDAVRFLFVDEADGIANNAEGCPIELAEKRTLSFKNRKIVISGTPTFSKTSNVLRSYELSDRRIYEVPCPECGHFHEIGWSDIQWPEGEPEKAHYVCPECGNAINERFKIEMIAGGRWRALRPEIKNHAGFRANQLISTLPNASWDRLAREFLACKGRVAFMQVFTNCVLAQGWEYGSGSGDLAAGGVGSADAATETEALGLD
ncbi:hypothetical protein GJU93_10850 [Brucella sp. 10RB9212]|uniref:terminase gpA endonuclease subunit n=1 Tax=unclassified Brucella TaxID=2632610 RepID=UPI0009728D61|nr:MULTISPECIES: terminase gpA endonuclease subunit [unclassified Brucella]APY12970.1 hypothetical protein BKD02_00440 [Brucella sp. 09RB8910]MRN47088.1 hypothetical protein [Brucella sp. 10RB9212]